MKNALMNCLAYPLHIRALEIEYRITWNEDLIEEIRYAKKLYKASVIYYHYISNNEQLLA